MNTGPLSGARILILEDNLLIAMDIEQALEAQGAEAVICVNLAEALDTLANGPFDYVLSDYSLNGDSSLPLAKAAAKRGIPMALLTGYSPEHLDLPAPRLKIFVKPFREEDIIEHIVHSRLRSQTGNEPRPAELEDGNSVEPE